ncbi:hypothetical protein LTS18_003222, partial [Coniosporium uncinatum]
MSSIRALTRAFPAKSLTAASASLPNPSVTPNASRAAFSSARIVAQDHNPKIMLEDPDKGFGFIRHNPGVSKPRKTGVTEIRGPYYSVMGKRYLQDVLDT